MLQSLLSATLNGFQRARSFPGTRFGAPIAAVADEAARYPTRSVPWPRSSAPGALSHLVEEPPPDRKVGVLMWCDSCSRRYMRPRTEGGFAVPPAVVAKAVFSGTLSVLCVRLCVVLAQAHAEEPMAQPFTRRFLDGGML